MNSKIAAGIGIAALVLVGAYALTHQKFLGTDGSQNAPPPLASTSVPTFTVGTATRTITVRASALFDRDLFVSTSTYPTVTGTANISKVGIIIYNDKHFGLVGTPNVLVEKGHWTYYSSYPLAPGTYSVLLLGGAENVTATLVVKNP